MRLAFWRASKNTVPAEKPMAPKVQPKAAPLVVKSAASPVAGDLDLHALGQALVRKRQWIVVPTVLALVLSIVAVNIVTPRYKSEARILIDGRENIFLRPNGERNEERTTLDAEAVTSQVQLLLSRDLATQIIKKNKLAELPEFDPVLGGLSPLKSLLALLGIGRDPFSLTPEERVLDAYFDRYTAYAVDKSRVIVIEFSRAIRNWRRVSPIRSPTAIWCCSRMRGRTQAKTASQWLAGEIDSLRKKVEDGRGTCRGFPVQVEPVRRHQQHHAVQPADGRDQHPAQQCPRALKSDAETKGAS